MEWSEWNTAKNYFIGNRRVVSPLVHLDGSQTSWFPIVLLCRGRST